MKIKAKNLGLKKLINGNTELVLEVDDKKSKIANQIFREKTLLDVELEVVIDKWRKKRNLGHNALFWDMCNYLSDHINDPLITPTIIYKDLVREYGVSIIYPVPNDLLDMAIETWEMKGEGWQTQMEGKSLEKENSTDVKFWFGSSSYNSKQMWKLVEGLKQMCRDNNLDISYYDKELQASIKAMEEREKALEQKKNEQTKESA